MAAKGPNKGGKNKHNKNNKQEEQFALYEKNVDLEKGFGGRPQHFDISSANDGEKKNIKNGKLTIEKKNKVNEEKGGKGGWTFDEQTNQW